MYINSFYLKIIINIVLLWCKIWYSLLQLIGMPAGIISFGDCELLSNKVFAINYGQFRYNDSYGVKFSRLYLHYTADGTRSGGWWLCQMLWSVVQEAASM